MANADSKVSPSASENHQNWFIALHLFGCVALLLQFAEHQNLFGFFGRFPSSQRQLRYGRDTDQVYAYETNSSPSQAVVTSSSVLDFDQLQLTGQFAHRDTFLVQRGISTEKCRCGHPSILPRTRKPDRSQRHPVLTATDSNRSQRRFSACYRWPLRPPNSSQLPAATDAPAFGADR